jgi:hypothetical protein
VIKPLFRLSKNILLLAGVAILAAACKTTDGAQTGKPAKGLKYVSPAALETAETGSTETLLLPDAEPQAINAILAEQQREKELRRLFEEHKKDFAAWLAGQPEDEEALFTAFKEHYDDYMAFLKEQETDDAATAETGSETDTIAGTGNENILNTSGASNNNAAAAPAAPAQATPQPAQTSQPAADNQPSGNAVPRQTPAQQPSAALPAPTANNRPADNAPQAPAGQNAPAANAGNNNTAVVPESSGPAASPAATAPAAAGRQNQQAPRRTAPTINPDAPFARGSDGSGSRPANEAPAAPVTPAAPALPDQSGRRNEAVMARPENREPAREITVAGIPGKEMVITLDGNTWYPLGGSIDPALQFIRKEYDQTGATRFIFRSQKPGTYTLNFRRNMPTGIENLTVTLNVGDNSATSQNSTDETAPTAPQAAENNSGNTGENPSSSFIMQAVDTDNEAALTSRSNEVLQQAAADLNEADLTRLLRYTVTKPTLTSLSDRLTQIYLQRFGLNDDGAEILYKLGQLYEQNSPQRNIARAYGYYTQVYNNYPISPYSRMSKERMDYLDRFYIRIP